MHLEVVAIEQSMPLKTKKTQNYLRLRMPNDDEIVLAVSEEEMMRVLRADQEAPPENGHAVVNVGMETTAEAHNSWDQTWGGDVQPEAQDITMERLNWTELDDEQLPAFVKGEFSRMGLPEMMTVAEITQYAHHVMAATTEMPPEAEPPPQPEPARGKVVPLHKEPDVDADTGVPSI